MTIIVSTTEAPPNTVYVTAGPEKYPPQPNYAPPQVNYVPAQNYVPPPPQTTYVQVVNNPRPNRWSYKQKGHTASAGILMFAYGGMDMAQCLGWNILTGIPSSDEFRFSFFIGIIIGAVVAALLIDHLPKWVFYSLAGVMQLIDAIIYVSASYEYVPLVAAHYVGGAGLGLLTVTFIIHNSEVTGSDSRGVWCSVEQYGLALGIAIQVIIDSEWYAYNYVGVNEAHGIFGIVFSLIATCAVALSVESPIFYLRKNQEEKAKSCQWQLLTRAAPVTAFNVAFDEAKQYVAQGNSQSIGAQLSESAMPFIKMIFCRCLVAFTFSLPLSLAMSASSTVAEGYLDSWTVILWGLLRWFGTFFTICLVDTVGRKFISLLGLLCMAGLMLGMAGIFSDWTSVVSTYYMYQVSRISMAFQFFAGIYVSCTATYLGEAFPMRVKGFLIGLIVCIEQVIHIIVIVTYNSSSDFFYQYFLAVGIILVVSMIIFAVLMPETKKLTLRQAGERFHRVHDVMAY